MFDESSEPVPKKPKLLFNPRDVLPTGNAWNLRERVCSRGVAVKKKSENPAWWKRNRESTVSAGDRTPSMTCYHERFVSLPSPAMKIDLHCHSNLSDGSLTPRELAARATARGVEILSITDHDTVAAYAMLHEREQLPLKLIPGVEFSTTSRPWVATLWK